MNTLQKVKNSIFILGLGALTLTACTKDDEPEPAPAPNDYVKSGEIVADETWTADHIYTLDGKVIVTAGATLTIEPGTIIKAESGQGAAASALIVSRGAEINAVGTPAKPIVFTSVTDNIALGEKLGTNLQRDDNQLWGGIIILGNAPISAENGDTESTIEGIPPEEGYGQYGGSESGDSSGDLSYVSIRHGGISIGEGNEINGLTLGGVGNGTNISNIEVYATLDDGIEFFGGTVDADKIMSYYQGDDGIDIDQNYSGTVSNFVVIQGDGVGTDEGLEIDGPEGSTYTDGMFTLENGICILEGSDGSAADFKSKAQGYVMNVSFQSQSPKPVKFRTKFDESCMHEEDAFTHLSASPATLTFEGSKFMGGIEVYDSNADESNPTSCPEELDEAIMTAENLINLNGSGATLDIATTFEWTCAALRGQL